MNRKYGTMLMAFGLFIVAISLVTAQNLAIIDSGNSLDRWSVVYGTQSVSSSQYVSSPSSIAWVTDISQSVWSSYLSCNLYNTPYVIDLTSTPILSFKIYPTSIPTGGWMKLWLYEEPWASYDAGTLSLTANQWNTVTVDLRNFIDVTKARHFRLEFGLGGSPVSNIVTYVDDVELTSGSSPTPTPSPSSSPTPQPTSTPTPAPGETPAPSASPNGTEPTPEPTLEPGATPTPEPSFGTDDLNRMGVFAGLGVFGIGAVITFTGRKRK